MTQQAAPIAASLEGAAFDGHALRYDESEEGNVIKQRLRRLSLQAIHEAFPEPCRLLDVGAGTGTEAIALALAGHRVVATDPSTAMLERLRCKAEAAGAEVENHVVPARDVGGLGLEPFDGAYCSFGGLNLEPDLRPVASALAGLVRAGGRFVASTMTRHAVLQAAGAVAVLRPRQAIHRLGGTATFAPPDGGPGIPVYYPTLRRLRGAFQPWFRVESMRALNLFVPGPGAWPYVRRVPGLLCAAAWLDDRTAGVPGLRALADHVLVVFRRSEGGAEPQPAS